MGSHSQKKIQKTPAQEKKTERPFHTDPAWGTQADYGGRAMALKIEILEIKQPNKIELYRKKRTMRRLEFWAKHNESLEIGPWMCL